MEQALWSIADALHNIVSAVAMLVVVVSVGLVLMFMYVLAKN